MSLALPQAQSSLAENARTHGRATLRALALVSAVVGIGLAAWWAWTELPGSFEHGPDRAELAENEDVKEFYLGISSGKQKSFRDVKHYRRRKRWLA